MNKKDEILDAVISKFRTEGFTSNLTISQIAKTVDIGKSTIYEYFKTKDEIVREALLKITNESIKSIFDIENIENLGFEEAFKKQLKRILEVSLKSRMSYEIFSKDFIHSMPQSIRSNIINKMEDVKRILEKRFLLMFEKGFKEKLLHIKPSQMNNLIFSSLIAGSIFRYSNCDFKISIDDFVNEIYKTVIKIAN